MEFEVICEAGWEDTPGPQGGSAMIHTGPPAGMDSTGGTVNSRWGSLAGLGPGSTSGAWVSQSDPYADRPPACSEVPPSVSPPFPLFCFHPLELHPKPGGSPQPGRDPSPAGPPAKPTLLAPHRYAEGSPATGSHRRLRGAGCWDRSWHLWGPARGEAVGRVL